MSVFMIMERNIPLYFSHSTLESKLNNKNKEKKKKSQHHNNYLVTILRHNKTLRTLKARVDFTYTFRWNVEETAVRKLF